MSILTLFAAAAIAAAPAARADVPAKATSPADPDVVLSREDVQEVKAPAHRLGRIAVTPDGGAAVVQVGADGGIGRIGILELRNPARLALDLYGLRGKFGKAEGTLLVKGVRVGRNDQGMRVVIDAEGDTMPAYQIGRASCRERVLACV